MNYTFPKRSIPAKIFGFVFILGTVLASAAAEERRFQSAPLNPAYLQYLETLRFRPAAAAAELPGTPAGHPLGKRPSPVKPFVVSRPSGVRPSNAAASQAAYDLRDYDRVTSVKDQGSCGDCWAFGAMGSLESYFKPGETLDLSEADLNANSGFDFGFCNGGNNYMSAAYMARWSGPLPEASSEVVKHAQNMVFIPLRSGPADNDGIKSALLEYGGLSVAFRYADADYNAANHAFYANLSTSSYSSNHVVTIVGWDDAFPKASFNAVPPGDGAFLVKNSWGTAWGDAGYFHVSYYDGIFGRDDYTTAFTGEASSNYSRVYSYDKLGWVADFTYGTTTAWFSNIFTALGNEGLSAAGFYTNDAATNYTIYIYTGVTAGQPTSGTLAYSASGSFTSPGYHTVPVGYVGVGAGQLFSAVVKVTNASYAFPIPAEAQDAGYSSQAAASGKSYTSADGAVWDALTGVPAGDPTNAALKVYAVSKPPAGTVTLTDNLFRPQKDPAVKCQVAVTIFAAGTVTVKAYTMNGALVRTIYSGPQGAGTTNYSWDGKTDNGNFVASGLYLVNTKGPSTNTTEKVVVIR
ncbi:MAG TPA: lectin like domain-containing protein [Elusimicrobiales bacterium]|nr:lectin like domain-containing protein [Elusimicrobiales bacterium]